MGVLSPLLGWCVPAIRCQQISIRCQKIAIPAAVQTCVGPVEWVRGTGPAGVRTEVRPGSQTGRFRSRRRDEVATTCLRADERAQARSLFEDRHCRRGHARTRFGQQRQPRRRGRRRLLCGSILGRSETSDRFVGSPHRHDPRGPATLSLLTRKIRTGLGKSEVVGVRGLAAAQETRLLADVAKVLPVAIATRGRDRENALVDALRLTSVDAVGSGIQLRLGNLRHRRLTV
jgi:hypothetical protein